MDNDEVNVELVHKICTHFKKFSHYKNYKSGFSPNFCLVNNTKALFVHYLHWLRCSENCSPNSVQTLDICFKFWTIVCNIGWTMSRELRAEGDVVGQGGQVALRGGRMKKVHKLWL